MTVNQLGEQTQTRTIACAHCGDPTLVPASTSDEPVFCCGGCEGAHRLIHGWGLQDYYALRDDKDALRADSLAGIAPETNYQVFDSDEFLGRSAPQPQAGGLMSTELAVDGLHCAACAWLIENAATRTPGWRSARVRLNRHTLRILFDPTKIVLSEIARLLGRLGYRVSPLGPDNDAHIRQQSRRQLVQIAIAGFCAANAMWIAVALYAGESTGLASHHQQFLRWMGSGLGLIAVAVPGRTFFVSALASLKTRTPHMDLPVALGLSVGLVSTVISLVSGQGDVYFDSLAVLVFLLLVGRWIQFRQQHRAIRSVDLLLRLTPRHATLIDTTGQPRLVPTDTIRVGDQIRVAPGENIPVDGKVTSGQSLIDRSLLTGESVPVVVHACDEVNAGTINRQSSIDVRAEAVGSETRVGKVMQSVEEAAARRTPIIQLADRVGGVFVVVVLILALLTFAYWLPHGWSQASSNATALLIVACPCALALATPLAIAVSIGRAANRQILIRDSSSLQRLSQSGMVWFDKTGTLTEGHPTAELVYGDPGWLQHAASVERECRHPVADAIVRAAEAGAEQIAEQIAETRPTLGRLDAVHSGGVCGVSDGHRVVVGNVDFVESQRVHVGDPIRDAVDHCAQRETSPIVIAIDGEAAGVVAVVDPLKPDAGTAVSTLADRGWQAGILSGDHQAVVSRVARAVGIETGRALGGQSPEDKLERIGQTAAPTVVMIGDGVNDAAALAGADVGIAVRGGAEASLQTAPVYVASPGLGGVCELIDGSRSTMNLIHATFAISLTYNVVAVLLAMTGRISPLIAAVLMPISSLSVLAMTLAWRPFRGSRS